MLDGILLERAGVPAASICTTNFVPTAQATAAVQGAPDFPVIYTPHPISSLTRDQIRAQAEAVAEQVVAVLTSERPALGEPGRSTTA